MFLKSSCTPYLHHFLLWFRMYTASLSELKKELATLDAGELRQLCIRLVKYKVENKELLSYLLFHSENEDGFIEQVKLDIETQFASLNTTNLYWAKKTIRKVLRTTNKYVRYSGNRQTEIELRLYFCQKVKEMGLPFRHSTALSNLYDGQLKKINKALNSLHEDLQYDYRLILEEL